MTQMIIRPLLSCFVLVVCVSAPGSEGADIPQETLEGFFRSATLSARDTVVPGIDSTLE